MTRPIRRLRPGEPLPDKAARRYVNTTHGYAVLRWNMGDHYVEALEHRAVMGNPEGQVHHINGHKLDNWPENLSIMSASDHTRHHHPRRTDVRRAITLYRAGRSTVEIARELNTYPGNISRLLRAEGVEMRDSGCGQRVVLSPPQQALLERCLAAGLPVAFIARGLGMERGPLDRYARSLKR